jgi:competence protein ComEC
VLVPLLRALDERLDTVVLSDSDHTGGAAAVLAMQPDAKLLGSIEPGHPLQQLRPARPCLAGQHWEWDGVRFDVLHPKPGDADREGIKSNALSCVLRVTGATGQALLAGDIEREQEAALAGALAPGSGLRADVLLVPHHGSKTSSSALFLDAVAPRLAIVQAGYRNRFGHPAPEVLQRFDERQVFVADTPRCGAVRWQSNEPMQWHCEREVSRRYWQH